MSSIAEKARRLQPWAPSVPIGRCLKLPPDGEGGRDVSHRNDLHAERHAGGAEPDRNRGGRQAESARGRDERKRFIAEDGLYGRERRLRPDGRRERGVVLAG